MSSESEFCSAHEAIQILQEKWVLHIVRELLNDPKGFNELSRAVGGCNPATLSQRLDRLAEIGIVERTVQSLMPPRTLYTLTPAGVALQAVIESIDAWGRSHLKKIPGTSETHLKAE